MLLIFFLLITPINADLAAADVAFAAEFVSQINEVRSSGCMCDGRYQPNVTKVKWHPKLELSATLHARQMMRYHFFEHYSKGGKNIGERVQAVGYPWRTVGENLARGQRSVAEVIEDWMESPKHCHLLMNPKFEEMGAAHVGEYWVLHMGAR